jgi:hypothetical protein
MEGDAQDYIPPSPLSCMVGARSAARVPDARGTFEGAGSIARNTREEQGQDVREARAVTAMKHIPIAILLLCLAAPLLAAGCVSGGGDDVAVVEYHRTGGIAGFDLAEIEVCTRVLLQIEEIFEACPAVREAHTRAFLERRRQVDIV